MNENDDLNMTVEEVKISGERTLLKFEFKDNGMKEEEPKKE